MMKNHELTRRAEEHGRAIVREAQSKPRTRSRRPTSTRPT